MSKKAQQLLLPIGVCFEFARSGVKSGGRVQIWLYDQKDIRLEGVLKGIDEFMNCVLDDAVEVSVHKKTTVPLGRMLLKGDNISLMLQL